jgi:hypothetical protein
MTLKSSVKLDYDFHTTDRMIRVAAGNTMLNRIKRNSVIAYFIIAYAVSWSFEIPLALVKQGLIGLSIPLWFHYFVALGPLMAAMVFTWLYNSTAGSLWIVILFHGVFDWLSSNEAGGPFAAALLSMAVILWALYIPRRYGMENAAASAKQIA